MPLLDVPGTSIHYELRGPQDAPVVAFLNGVMMSVRSWVLQRPVFERRYRCLYHDFRGQLSSGKPEGPYSFEQHVADLVELLDHLGVERCHLVGTSYGGEVGMLFAADHPQRVETLSVIASVAEVEPLLAHQVAIWRSVGGDGRALFRVTAPFNYSNRFLASGNVLLAQGEERMAAAPPDFFVGLEHLIDAFLRLDLVDRLADIRCPTLVLCGDEDLLKPPAASRRIADAIPDAELLLVAGAAHAVVIEQAAAVNTAVLGFLEKHRRAEAAAQSRSSLSR